MKKKNGFTLVELLAVVVVLILIIFIAIISVKKSSVKVQLNSLKANSISFVKATNSLVAVNNGDGTSTPIEGVYTVDMLYEIGVKLDGKKPDAGYVLIDDSKVISGCLSINNKYRTLINNGSVMDPEEQTCPLLSDENTIIKSHSYTSTADEKSLTINEAGTYLLEAWGAQGGSATSSYTGGYGGYSKTYLTLNDGESLTLYINVGGAGASDCNRAVCNGGYNGGGSTGSGSNSSIYYGGGGGATSIAIQSGLLSTLSSNQNKVLLVAGGGGGATKVNSTQGTNGASGGGYIGSSTNTTGVQYLYLGFGGSQLNGGTSSFTSSNPGQFGAGGTFISAIDNIAQGGAGSGYYGGGYAGGGGSGYFAQSFILPSNNRVVTLQKSVMYCYECEESVNPSSKTKQTTFVSEDAYSNYVKSGDGFARITYIG